MKVLNLVWHQVFLLHFCSGSEMQQGTASMDKGGRVSTNFECQLLEINFKKNLFYASQRAGITEKKFFSPIKVNPTPSLYPHATFIQEQDNWGIPAITVFVK